MLRQLTLLFLAFILVSFSFLACKKQKKRPTYDVTVTGANLDSLKENALKYNVYSHEDSLERTRLRNLGGVFLIRYDYDSKCNLTTGYYYLTKAVKNAEDLQFISEYMAKTILKNHRDVPNCKNPISGEAIIYKDFPGYNSSLNNWLVRSMVEKDALKPSTTLATVDSANANP